MTFTPVRLVITAITNANPAVVTTSTNHALPTGEVVRINIPQAYGMQQLNKALVQITHLSSVTFSLQYHQANPQPVDSTGFAAFAIPVAPIQQAEVIPVGSSSTPLKATPNQVLQNRCASKIDGALDNIKV